jgi:eukaryotic-like serine/threonine-protein kinase
MQTFGIYTNLVEIGNGGMATVYRATAPNGNLVALKVLARYLATDPIAQRRFEQESKLGLNHPSIVSVLDYGIEDGTPYLVMEYVVGESLERRLSREGTLTPQQLGPILIDAGSALDFAHALGVIHRDVKPSNILIRSNGDALLADFGVAKSSWQTAYTATAARVGSVFYMSPEQANGAVEITPATDIYSLGVTAYYALCGRHPFEASNDIAIARMHLDEKPPHVCDVNPGVPRGVGAVVMEALEKDPSRRPVTAGVFARAFQGAAQRASRSGRLSKRMKLATVITAGCVLPVAVVATILTTSGQNNPAFNTAISSPSVTAAPMPSPQPTMTVSPMESAMPTPDSTTIPGPTPTLNSTKVRAPISTRRISQPAVEPSRTPTRQPTATTMHTPAPSVTEPPLATEGATTTPETTATPLPSPSAT